jgi:hypothetical protein
MDADLIADLVGLLRPALQALAAGPKERAALAFDRLELDVARWAVRHAVTPEGLDRVRAAFRSDADLRRAVAASRTGGGRRRAAALCRPH